MSVFLTKIVGRTLFCVLVSAFVLPGLALAQDCDQFDDRIGISSGADPRVTIDAFEGDGPADDTDIINCALEIAADNGISRVQMQQGEFFISSITVRDFKGSLEGRSIANTTLNLIPASIDCAAQETEGFNSAALRFIGGEPKVRTMTIEATNICSNDNRILTSVINFTGENAFADCENDLIKAEVDRVVLNGPPVLTDVDRGIQVAAQGYLFGTCRNTLLGTFKLNRSEIHGMNVGLITSMQGSAQVDVNFNTFSNQIYSYWMDRSRQITSVTLNDFSGEVLGDAFNAYGIRISSGLNAPDKTSLTISGNTFTYTGGENIIGAGVFNVWSDSANLSLVIKENTFNISGPSGLGIGISGANNTVIIDNRFIGNSDFTGIYVSTDFGDGTSSLDTAILANNFSDYEGGLDDHIRISPDAIRTVVGPGQNALVLDFGVDSILTDNDVVVTSPLKVSFKDQAVD